ncbi:predicted protein [Neisseria gonorrhoeae PID18]|nr:predicted protein [Neisseria gonorrhoeae PID18]
MRVFLYRPPVCPGGQPSFRFAITPLQPGFHTTADGVKKCRPTYPSYSKELIRSGSIRLSGSTAKGQAGELAVFIRTLHQKPEESEPNTDNEYLIGLLSK